MFLLRFDLRAPDGNAEALYAAALDMAAWGEEHGCFAVVLSEHHGSPDGYLPSPLVMAAAVAGRTRTVPIMVAAAPLPFYDPVRLAEDLTVLDLVSGGRASVTLSLGYRPEEYALYGTPMAGRGALADERLAVLLGALRDGEVDTGDRIGAVTPRPPSPDRPRLSYGGSSPAAARRAARFGLDLVAQTDDPALGEAYRAECDRLGREPGAALLPDPSAPYALFVAEDVDRAWDELGPHLLHDARLYASWNEGDHRTVSLSRAASVDELRSLPDAAHRIVDVDEAVQLLRTEGILMLHPLCGGIPPEVAWPYLRRVADEVVPALST